MLGADFERVSAHDADKAEEIIQQLAKGLTVIRGTDEQLVEVLEQLPRTRVIVAPHAADLFDQSVSDNVYPVAEVAEKAIEVASCDDIPGGSSYNDREHGQYFAALSEFVCQGLDRAGQVLCPGDMMASNPEWRKTADQWISTFHSWITAPEPDALLHAQSPTPPTMSQTLTTAHPRISCSPVKTSKMLCRAFWSGSEITSALILRSLS